MGGLGSGRRGGKQFTSDYRQLDVRKLHKAGVLEPGYLGRWNWYRGDEVRASIVAEATSGVLALRYSAICQGERRSYSYPVHLSWTNCTYGGARPWFLCPKCGRRVAILYGGARFVCRHCRQLAYPVQRESDNYRTIRRVDAIRKRLGWRPGIFNGTGWKPKGMHWRKFWRLRAECIELTAAGLEGISRELGRVSGALDAVECRELRRLSLRE
ncbi:MAG: hypothetical protein KDH15_13620 [Rhodocyclaceae bacterium]|nr:hypothetical protein [Rhodocyclaceae bacterium]